MAARRDRRGGQRQRGVHADAVDHETGAAARGAPDVGSGQPVRLQGGVGAGRERHVERLLPAVDRDDAAAAQGPQQLDGDVAEASDADHHRGGAGPQVAQRALDRVVRRQRRVGERRGGRRVEVADRDRDARGREDDVLREAAVAPDAAAGAAPQVARSHRCSSPRLQRGHRSAAPGAVDEHRLTDGEAVGAIAELVDGPDDLVTERERQRVRHRPLRPMHQVQVRVAEAGARARAAGPRRRRAPASGTSRTSAGCCQETSWTARIVDLELKSP